MSDPSAPPAPPPQTRQVVMPGAAQGRRRLNVAAVGLVLMIAAGAGFLFLVLSIDQSRPYLVAGRDIARWEIITTADLTTVEADVGTASAMLPTQAGSLVGQWATGVIPQGTLITPGMFQRPPLSAEGESNRLILEIALPLGDVAFGTLATGDRVALIGREPLSIDQIALAEAAPGAGAQGEAELALLGILRLEQVRDGKVLYVVEPAQAVYIQNLVNRYLASAERQMWKIGPDVTAEDIAAALRGEVRVDAADSAASVGNVSGTEEGGDEAADAEPGQ